MRTLEEIKQCERLAIQTIGIDGGAGIIYMQGWSGTIIWSFGGGWEHVSVAPKRKRITPSWDDMCRIKDIFFNEEECVVQYHPPKSEYVNITENCLHLWRPVNGEVAMPPSIMVGPK